MLRGVDALDRADLPGLREELGDLLFQIVFPSRLGKEDGRSPRPTSSRASPPDGPPAPPRLRDDTVSGTSEVLARWEEIKKEEKRGAAKEGAASVLDGIPTLSLPS
jgi:uncharacterized protein YabN with tetrapyrrole methylase and pyrophosphatase domain